METKINLNHPKDWTERARLAATFIKPNSRVVEYGAGEQRLKQFLPEGCSYSGYDIAYDGLDLEIDWPLFKILPDTEIVLGLLEWLDDVPKFISKLTAKQVIVSYATFHSGFDLRDRMDNGWKNHYYGFDITKLFADNNYHCVDSISWNDQVIFNFQRIND